MNTINFIKAVKKVFALPLISWGTIICMFLLIFPAMLFSQSGEKYSVNGNYLGAPDILGSKNYAPLNFATNSTIRALFTADGNFEVWYKSYFKKSVVVDSTITAWEIYAMYRLSVYGDVVVTGIMKSAKLILTDGNITSMTGTVVFGSNNLTTTGNVTAGSFNSPSFAGSSRAMLATDTAGNIIRKEYSGNPDEVLTGDGNWSNLSQSTGWQWVDTNLVSTAAQVVVANNLAVGGKITVGQMKVISNGSNKDTLHTEKELVIITDSKNISLDADTVKIPRLLDSRRMETDTLTSKKINASKVYVAGDVTSTGTVYTGNLYVANDVMLPLFAGTKNLLLTDSTGKVSPLGISSTSNKVLLSNGTWGAVPIPQNYWQMQNDDIYTLTPGNIGLGMNNPAYKLDVAGTVRISEDLLVGGGIIISEKVNATRELKSASLRADSIFMDNTKAFYGESRFADSVKIQSKLRVDGNIDAGGDLRSSGSLIFGSNKNISYFPHQNGITGDLCFGTPIPAYTICNPPVTETNQNWFGGTVNMWGNPNWNSQQPSSILKVGSDGSNGIIEVEGTNAGGGEAQLLINYYCGRNVVVGGRGLDDPSHPGPETGTFTTRYDTYLAERNGNVGIGTSSPAQDSKLHIREMGGAPVFATIQNNNGSTKIGYRSGAGTIDSESSSGIYGDLLLNCFTGNNVVIGGNQDYGINSGDLYANHSAYLATIEGKVRIGSNQPATAKLDVEGDVRISVLTASSAGTFNIVTADDNGLLGTKTATEIGDNLGDHTATQDIFLNNKSLYLRGAGDSNHGIKFTTNFANAQYLDGPAIFGYKTGILGTTFNGEKAALFWNKDGYVGIGTENPLSALHVKGGIFLEGDEFTTIHIKKIITGATATIGYSNFNDDFYIHNMPQNLLLSPNGNVGIGILLGFESPTEKLEIGSGHNLSLRAHTGNSEDAGDIIFKKFNGTTKARIWSNNSAAKGLFLNGGGLNGSNPVVDMIIDETGRVGIGTTSPNAKFQINVENNSDLALIIKTGSDENVKIFGDGNIWARRVRVKQGSWSDFVLKNDYLLISPKKLREYIYEFHHLPGVPTEQDVLKNGIDLGEINAVLLQKIEELTLYMLQQQDEIDMLKKQIGGK